MGVEAGNAWHPAWRRVFSQLLPGVLLALAAGLGVGRAADVQAVLGEAQDRLVAREPERTWELLAPLELEAAGSPSFDYIYGVAALDTGRLDAAIVALERVLAREPDFAGARMELARARFEAGDHAAAREQFSYLLTQAPPPGTRAVIERYLEVIDLGAPERSRFAPYAELGAGWDSNANASTGNETFAGFLLDPDNVETDSAFFELAGGFGHALAAGRGGAVVSTGRASYRFNPDADFVDQALVSLGTAGQKNWGENRATAGASGYYGWLDGSQHELGAGIDLGLSRQLGSHWEVGSTGRAGMVRYQQDELEVLDVNRYLGSVSLIRSISDGNGRAGLVALFGADDARRDTSPYSNDRLGARLFAGWQLGTRSSLYLEAGYLETDFDDSPGFFGIDREDDQWTAGLRTEYRDWPARGYLLVPTLRYTQTDSTVSLYEYDRFEFGVYLRRVKR